MNRYGIIFASVGVTIAAIVAVYIISYMNSDFDAQALDFDYTINSKIAEKLEDKGISMSLAVKISTPSGIKKYCMFFEDAVKQGQIQYCTSTELLDQGDNFVGNIHMIGTVQSPKLVIVVLEIPFGETDNVIPIFDTVIDVTVCDCWEQESPGGFADVSDWINALNEFHRHANVGITTKSSVIALEDEKIQSELTTTHTGKLWKLFVAK